MGKSVTFNVDKLIRKLDIIQRSHLRKASEQALKSFGFDVRELLQDEMRKEYESPSAYTLRDNPYLSNPDQYEQELRASCFGDESKIAAEVLGEWGQVTAGFFGSCLSIERCMLPRDFQIPWMPDGDGVFRESSKAKW